MNTRIRPTLPWALLLVMGASALPPQARADVKLATLFSDHAILQRDAPVPVWG